MKKLEGTGLLAQITNLVSQEILRIAKLHDTGSKLTAATALWMFTHFANTFGALAIRDAMQITEMTPEAGIEMIRKLQTLSSDQWATYFETAATAPTILYEDEPEDDPEEPDQVLN